MLRSFAFLLLAVCATPLPLSAQTFADADRLLASQDTSEAIAALEAMLEHDRKNAEAHYRVGMLYQMGEGVKADLVQAYAWLYVAAESSHVTALKALNKVRELLPPEKFIKADKLGKRYREEFGV